jgi:hypothetical protein
MALPKYFAPGDTLELLFVAREPRLTFALSQTPQAASAPTEAPVVSTAGRMVASVLPRPGEAAMPATVVNAAPLLDAATQNGAALSDKLQGTLTQSGLFYESHQAEWVSGKRDLALLLREPQARLVAEGSAEPQTSPESQVRAESLARLAPGGRPEPQARAAATAQQQPAQPLATAPAAGTMTGVASASDLNSPAAASPGERAMPQQVQALVQQQLAALETGKMVFQLQIWPGQWMQWEIDEDAQQSGARTGTAPHSFQTRLHLDLPRLGAIDATLGIDASGVHLRLSAASATSAQLLQGNRASLSAALADAGMQSVDIAVARHGTA